MALCVSQSTCAVWLTFSGVVNKQLYYKAFASRAYSFTSLLFVAVYDIEKFYGGEWGYVHVGSSYSM